MLRDEAESLPNASELHMDVVTRLIRMTVTRIQRCFAPIKRVTSKSRLAPAEGICDCCYYSDQILPQERSLERLSRTLAVDAKRCSESLVTYQR